MAMSGNKEKISVTSYSIYDGIKHYTCVRNGNKKTAVEPYIKSMLYAFDVCLSADGEVTYTDGSSIPETEAGNKPVVDNVGDLSFDKQRSMGGSSGNLPKWVLRDSAGLKYYAKGRSSNASLEPEAEVCAYKLASLFGVPAIQYDLVCIEHLPQLPTYPVCISRDYSNGLTVTSLSEYVESVTCINPAQLNGRKKFDLVISVLKQKDLYFHNAVLHLDYIVGNRDRHLRNFDVWTAEDGKLISLVPMFDTGDSLFAAESESEIIRACESGNNYIHSKPYGNPHYHQLGLLQEAGYAPALNSVSKESIYQVINSCFTCNRAKYLGQYVRINAERLGLLCQK
jgi:hypothetical protein